MLPGVPCKIEDPIVLNPIALSHEDTLESVAPFNAAARGDGRVQWDPLLKVDVFAAPALSILAPMISPSVHDQAWHKRQAMAAKLAHSAPRYDLPLTKEEHKILGLSLAETAEACTSGRVSPASVLDAYAKRSFAAHVATNCLADTMFDEALSTYAPDRPFSGIPISIKDVVDIQGHDTTIGYSSRANKPVSASAPIVRILKDAGALLHVKTTVPTGLFSFECKSDLFGETTNPYNPKFSPGGSTGGGAALLAYGGSKIEVASDVGGSVRFPAAYCGVYGMKATSGRFPDSGIQCSLPGLQTLPAGSPLARSLDDLEEFWARLIGLEPWKYDPGCVPVPWRKVDFVLESRKPKWGVIWNDGVMTPTPACRRALALAVGALQEQGHEVDDFHGPSAVEGLKIGYPLGFADGGSTVFSMLQHGENINSGLTLVRNLARLPLFVKKAIGCYLRWSSTPAGRNDAYADLLECMHPQSVAAERALYVQRDEFRARWISAMDEQGIDYIITLQHALPPMPRDGTGTATLLAASYCFLYNVLDVTAGVVPTAYVDSSQDALPPDLQSSKTYRHLSDAERAVWSLYDPVAMHGLPLAVQVVGRRYEEEKVLMGMKLVDKALRDIGRPFVQKDF